MKEIVFFEIPIYRCTLDKYLTEFEVEKIKIKDSLKEILTDSPTRFEKTVNVLINLKGYPYEYNEIVGWIKLFTCGNQIRGEYYFETNSNNRNKEKTRFNRGIRKKRFKNFGKAFDEINIRNSLTSNQISQILINKLELISRTNELFKNRYIDLSKFKNIVNYINWNDFLKNNK